jgi:ketosteroid isomerase-like protein
MNVRTGFILIGIAVMLCSGVAWSGAEEDAVEQVILAEAKSASLFAENRDKQAILKIYADGYSGIQDGELESRETIEKWLSEYEAELDRGSSLRFLSAVSGLKIRLAGLFAWVTYDYLFQAVRKGELEGQDAGKCTSVLQKHASAWLILHEHCSKARSNP